MSRASQFAEAIREGRVDRDLKAVYPATHREETPRLATLAGELGRHFDGEPIHLFSAPGRTELGGNHTDHNAGRVLAASVSLDTVAAVCARDDDLVEVVSEGYEGLIRVDLGVLEPDEREHGRPQALIRGVAAYLHTAGYVAGGFSAVVTSRVGSGSGLSSSAAFEVLIAEIFPVLYNGGRLPAVELALAGRHAENRYFGKPSGLMDQIACATGGVIAIDFRKEDEPLVERIPVNFHDHGYQLFAVDSGEDHADLTDDYAAIVAEMAAVARPLGADRLREVDYGEFRRRIPELRAEAGDRAVLRALHFFRENERVLRQSRMLGDGDIEGFLAEVGESGRSSWRFLQNCYSPAGPRRQGIAVALALSEEFLERPDRFAHPPCIEGATRVHGGGFAGTIQTYVPLARAAEYRESMAAVFGPAAVTELSVRETGVCRITDSRAHQYNR
ncbi:MAG: galactokinase [Spirochaetota bacterium]